MNIDVTQRSHHTFKQVASLLHCSVEELRYYLVEGDLSPSLYLPGKELPVYQMAPREHHGTHGDVDPVELTITQKHSSEIARTDYPVGYFYLVLGRQASAFERKFQFVASKPCDFDIGDLVFKLESPIGLDEVFETCVVMATELDRFKASHVAWTTGPMKANPPQKTSASPFLVTSEINTASSAPPPTTPPPMQTVEEPPRSHWPWGNHQTAFLGHLEAAAKRYWVNYDPTDPSTAPLNKEVIQWLRARKVSKNMANAIATMLRVDGLKTGPRK